MFEMAKVWVDPNDRVDSVEIRYTWSPTGTEPDWTNGKDEAEVMHVVLGTNPKVRQANIEIPRYLEGKDNYLLHYHFGGGGEHHEGFSERYTEEIVSREVEFVDHEGQVTEVRVLWSVGGWAAPNWTQARLEGLPLQIQKDTPGHDAEGEGIADEAIYELVQTVPLPRRFAARVWGPRGAAVEYCFQLLRNHTPVEGDEFVRWDNNHDRNYTVVLS
jgi:hypothetical protein